MYKKLLITFGCSWTYGVGAGYQPGMSEPDYKDIAWDRSIADILSFRGIISKKLNYTNKNFSAGGNSNQKQFRHAKEYFSGNEFEKDRKYYSEIVVLWGITSIYRDEWYSNLENKTINFQYAREHKNKALQEYIKHFFDDNNELRKIALDIIFWNKFFSKNNIKNYWFDTFNHHNYPMPGDIDNEQIIKYNKSAGVNWPTWEDFINQNIDQIDPEILSEIYDSKYSFAKLLEDFPGFNNFIDFKTKNRDLASYLAKHNGLTVINNTKPHMSSWKADNSTIDFLANTGIVNPHSFHPTQLGHQQLADYLITKIND